MPDNNEAITDLTAIATYADADLVEVVDVSEAAPADKNKKMTKAVLFDSLPDFGSGLTFGAETLSVYDEGTWTPTIVFSTDDGDLSYDLQVGAYTKIGNIVIVSCQIDFDETTASGDIRIGGLPFTSNSTANLKPGGAVNIDGMSGITGDTSWVLFPGTTQLRLQEGVTGNSANINETNSAATTNLVRVTAVYLT